MADISKIKVATGTYDLKDNLVREEVGKIKSSLVVSVKDYGAIGDGVNDDRQAIQSAIDYVVLNGGGVVNFPKGVYLVNSTVVKNEMNVGLFVDGNNVTLSGEFSNIKAGVEMESVLYLPTRVDKLNILNLYFQGESLANYCLLSHTYAPYMKIDNSRFDNAKDTQIHLYTFVSQFSHCVFFGGKRGILISGEQGNIATSCSLESCYANANSDIGFEFMTSMYCSLNACAVDHPKIGYKIYGRAFTMNGCGAEQCEKPLHVNCRGFSLNGLFMLGCGSSDANNPTDYLLHFESGLNVTISGVVLDVGMKSYNKVLGLTANSYGSENITVLDGCITRGQTHFVTNWLYNRPVKFLRDDETTKDESISVTADDLNDYLQAIAYKEINHTLTINVSGVHSTTSKEVTLPPLKGCGRIVINGDGSQTVLNGGSEKFKGNNVGCAITIQNLTFKNNTASTYSRMLMLNNCRHIHLKNIVFDSTIGNCGQAINAKLGTNVYLESYTKTGTWNHTTYSFTETDFNSYIKVIS